MNYLPRKSFFLLSLLVIFCCSNPFLFFPEKAVAKNLKVLSSQHKYSPEKDTSRSESAEPVAAKSNQRSMKIDRESRINKNQVAVIASADESLQKKISSKSAIVMDARSGEVLFECDADLPRQPASTIKVLTGLIAIEKLNNHDRVIPSRKAAGMPRSKVYLKPGKTYKADDLINAVLLASANDASVALAEKIGGSEKKFASLMTSKAVKLGARRTVCKSASGLTKAGQCSTARDLAVIFNEAMQNREFASRMKHTKVTTSYGKTLWNHNKALWRIAGAMGGKTGYTRAARQTYVGKFEKDGEELVVAIMGSENMWDDISRLVHYGFVRQKQRGKVQPEEDSIERQLARLRNELQNEHSRKLNTVQVLSETSKSSPQLSL
jgi:D-alanyl-D-alanine carboxypeptidase (penicillin-binding protein 5/6)